MRGNRRLTFLGPGSPLSFPDPNDSDDEGLLAVGGDLSPARLLFAYESGVFPWYSVGVPPLWWSPNPRALMDRQRLHVSRSLRRVLRQQRFEVTFDKAFADVIAACAANREGGTWILPEMMLAYTQLHQLGHAHSFEVWQGGQLAGGLYGVRRGALFAAESMFHVVSNASKVALAVSIDTLFRAGIRVFDVQFVTEHLASLGAYEVGRGEYLDQVARVMKHEVAPDLIAAALANWRAHF
ncbi:MAG TPA: leucyl/phenylalanyl-tRNA--protein transferase [Polyangiaceae bacterium]|nr:leucyl/phenylalanyl-tRNA--protein transferase [Polyangiaceae bacterium]